jgi:DNA replication protein DnaC
MAEHKGERRAERVLRIGVRDLTARGVEVLTPEEAAEAAMSTPEAVAARMMAVCKVPDLFLDAKLDDFECVPHDVMPAFRDATAKIKTLRQPCSRPRVVLLCGDVGLGKTHLCCALLLDLARAGQYVRFLDARAYITEATDAATGKTADPWSTILARYVRARLVVLDEVAAAIRTPFGQERVEELINARYNQRRDTILTGNATPEHFMNVVGDRVASRAREAGFIVVNGQDMRGRLLDRPSRDPT